MWAKTSSLTSFKYIKFYCNNIFRLFYKDESWEMLRCTTAGYLRLWFILSQWWTDPTCEMSHTLSNRWKCMKGKRTVRNSSCCSIRFKFSQWEEFISTKRRPYLSRLPVLGDRFGLALSPEIRFQVGSLQEPFPLPPGTPGPLTERMCSYWLCWCLLTFLWEGPKPHGRRLPITSHLKNENWTKKKHESMSMQCLWLKGQKWHMLTRILRNRAPYVADENVNDVVSVENSLAVPANVRHWMFNQM